MRDRFYSTADLARVCGVSISTIKRWTDAGLLRCVRTPGGHRKYRVQDVAEAARRLGLCSADTNERPAASVDELALLLLQGNREALAARVALALHAGDTASVRQLVLDLHRHGMRLVEAGLLLRAGLRQLDAQPAGSDGDAFLRRRASQLAATTARHLLEQAPALPPGAPLALVATAAGAGDGLAGCLVLLALAECGWRAVDLGAAATLDVVRGGLRVEHTDLVVWLAGEPDAATLDALRSETAASGAELVLQPADDDAALLALGSRALARERRLVAAMV